MANACGQVDRGLIRNKIQEIQASCRKLPKARRRASGPLPQLKPGGPRLNRALEVRNRLVQAESKQPGRVLSGSLPAGQV